MTVLVYLAAMLGSFLVSVLLCATRAGASATSASTSASAASASAALGSLALARLLAAFRLALLSLGVGACTVCRISSVILDFCDFLLIISALALLLFTIGFIILAIKSSLIIIILLGGIAGVSALAKGWPWLG